MSQRGYDLWLFNQFYNKVFSPPMFMEKAPLNPISYSVGGDRYQDIEGLPFRLRLFDNPFKHGGQLPDVALDELLDLE